MHRCLLLIALAGCGRVGFDPSAPDAAGAAEVADACASECEDLGAWSAPRLLAFSDAMVTEDDPTPSADGLELYFTATRSDTLGGADVYRVARAAATDPWGPVEHVVELSSTMNENTPELSADGLTLYMVSNRAGTQGNDDILVASRPRRDAAWSPPAFVPELSSPSVDRSPSLYLDGLAILFHSGRAGGPGGQDFWTSTRASLVAPWSAPVPLGPPNSAGDEYRGWMSPCGLELYFQYNASTGTSTDFYVTRRASLDEAFGPATRIFELSSTSFDQDLRLSPDRRHAYFSSGRSGSGDLYEATR